MDSLRLSLTTDYWVVDETGRLEDPDRVAGLPGADGTESPYSVAVETPPCADCGDLRDALTARLGSTVTAAHDRGCRLLALGVRPDLLADDPVSSTDQPPPAVTAGTRVVFEPEATAAADCYNTLVALDPAFVLINTTACVDGGQRVACGRPSIRHRGPTGRSRTPDGIQTAESTVDPDSLGEASTDLDSEASTDQQPVAWLGDGSKIVWRSLDASMPTLLVDLLADVRGVLEEAAVCHLRTESFGNGFHGDRLVLPDAEWRAIYTDEAIRKGASSLLVRAYLERLGIDTGWYRAATEPVDAPVPPADLPALCRRLAADLEADVGVPPLA